MKPRKLKSGCWRVIVPIYDIDLYFSFNEEHVEKQFKGYKLSKNHFAGRTSVLDNGRLTVHLITLYRTDINTAVHEISHAAMNILGEAGVKYTYNNQEALAYLTGYIAEQYNYIFHKEFNNDQ